MTYKEKLLTLKKLLGKLIKNPSSIFLILKDEKEHEDYLLKKYGKSSFPTIDIRYFLKDNTSEINNYTFLEGGSLATDLALLKSLATRFQACDYLEIGSWRGESIANVADVDGSQCISINLSPEEIIAMGFPEKYAYEHGCLLNNRANIHTIYTNSLTYNFDSLKKKFDLIFIDGDHKYKAVKSDTLNAFKLLKDENSVIVWHDYGYDPVTPRHSVIAAIMDGIPQTEHQHIYHISNTMCAIYTQSKGIIKHLQPSSDKVKKVFKINLEVQDFDA